MGREIGARVAFYSILYIFGADKDVSKWCKIVRNLRFVIFIENHDLRKGCEKGM